MFCAALSLLREVFALSAGLTIIVACFAFIVDFLEKVLVVCELLFVHAAHLTARGLLVHLAAQEVLVLLIDRVDLAAETVLFQLVVVLVSLPDDRLLVVKGLFLALTHALLLHLAGKQVAHLLLLLALALHAALVLKTGTHLFFELVLHESLLLGANAALLPANHLAG